MSKRGFYEWPEKALEMLAENYGLYTAKTLARRISKALGVTITERGLQSKAEEKGLFVGSAQGHLSITDAARELGVTYKTLHHHLDDYGFKTFGSGKCRFLTEEAFEHCKRFYSHPPEPTITIRETAERLGYSTSGITKLIQQKRLRAYLFGKRWRVATAAVSEMLMERQRELAS